MLGFATAGAVAASSIGKAADGAADPLRPVMWYDIIHGVARASQSCHIVVNTKSRSGERPRRICNELPTIRRVSLVLDTPSGVAAHGRSGKGRQTIG